MGASEDWEPGAGTDRLLPLVPGQELDDLLADPGEVGAQALQHLCGHTLALADQPQQHVLGSDVAVAELQRLTQRQLEHLLGSGGEGRGPGRSRTGQPDGLLDLFPDSLQRDAEGLESLGRDALTLVNQAQEDVFRANKAVVQQARFLLC